MRAYTILLGSVGGDSHNVGLHILRHALSANGYQICYLGIQNQLEDFFSYASLCNVVMISNMDGHAWLYLREFPELLKRYQLPPGSPLWYLGGNIVLGESLGHERQYLEMGFDRVYTKFVDIRTVLSQLAADLYNKEPRDSGQFILQRAESVNPSSYNSAPPDDMLTLQDIDRVRGGILEQWKTGSDAFNLNENAEFLKRQLTFASLQRQVNQGIRPVLVQPRAGVALVDEQIGLFQAFKRVGISALSYQVDSLTRNNDYPGAEEAIQNSMYSKHSVLNGFPVVNHGVTSLRRISNQIGAPLQTRHSTRDPRLLAEISYAGGVTAFEGGAICYNIPYYKQYALDESIARWQYVDRLSGLYYEKFGIVLDREFFGTLTGTLIPPSLAIVTGILESLLAVRQGVKSVSLGYAEQGNRVQDIAAIQMMGRMAREILDRLGYTDVQVNTVFHQYMAAFPEDYDRARTLIFQSAITGALSGATRILTKSPVESYKIPDIAENLEGISLVQHGLETAKKMDTIPENSHILEECEVIRKEVDAIIDSIFYCGNGNLVDGIIRGFRDGYLDIPFSPSIFCAGQVITGRDAQGAVRFISTGKLNFDQYLKDFHSYKMSERRRSEGISDSTHYYLIMEKDVLQIPRLEYAQWPLH